MPTHDELRGISLRDWFAGQAMSAIIAHSELVDDKGNFNCGPAKDESAIANFAAFAYLQADVMLDVRGFPRSTTALERAAREALAVMRCDSMCDLIDEDDGDVGEPCPLCKARAALRSALDGGGK